jgi:hypothetical protein
MYVTDVDGPIVNSSVSFFDQLKTASVLGGFGAQVAPKSPVLTSFVAAGPKPFVGFYYATESQPQLLQTARVVASRLKSALFSMAGFGSSDPVEPQLKPHPGDPLPLRFGLPDKNREALVAVLSPRKNLTAVVDSHGRITLVENSSGIAVRMWKGYRDAEVAWIEASSTSSRRYASFLAVYSPRRGLLEVWATQQGPRVAAFNVSRAGKLVSCSSYKMLGLNESGWAQNRDHSHQALFVDANGAVYSISVPLHLIDCEKNKRKAEDLVCLTKIRRYMGLSSRSKSSRKPQPSELQPVLEVFSKIETFEIIESALAVILGTQSEETMKKARSLWSAQRAEDCEQFLSILSAFSATLQTKEASEMSPEATNLLHTCSKLIQTAKLYVKLVNAKSDNVLREGKSWTDVLSPEEIARVKKLIALNSSKESNPVKSVRFTSHEPEKLPLTLPEFAVKFNFVHETKQLSLSSNDLNLHEVGATLLPSLNSTIPFSDEDGLALPVFLPFAFKYVLSMNVEDEKEYENISGFVLEAVSKLLSSYDEDTVLQTLSRVHEEILRSTTPLTPYLVAIVCRSVLSRKRDQQVSKNTPSNVTSSDSMQEVKLNEEESSFDDEAETSWEEVTAEEVGWTLMCSNLSSLAPLAMLVKNSPIGQSLSLKKYLEEGKAMVCEVVSRWCVFSGVDVAEMRKLGLIPSSLPDDSRKCCEL